jgi:hypothetical protein
MSLTIGDNDTSGAGARSKEKNKSQFLKIFVLTTKEVFRFLVDKKCVSFCILVGMMELMG